MTIIIAENERTSWSWQRFISYRRTSYNWWMQQEFLLHWAGHVCMYRHEADLYVCNVTRPLHPCALSGPYRPRGAHGFWADIIHFSGKSAYFGRKLSDRIWKIPVLRGGMLGIYVWAASLKVSWREHLIFAMSSYSRLWEDLPLGSIGWAKMIGTIILLSWEVDGPPPPSYPHRLPPSTRPARGDVRAVGMSYQFR